MRKCIAYQSLVLPISLPPTPARHYFLFVSVLQCYSGEQLLTIYNISHEDGVTQAEFEQLSAGLIQQLLQGCATDDHDDDDDDEPTNAQSMQIVGGITHRVCG